MPSRLFVVNEWLLADLNGENGDRARREAYDFLSKMLERRDRIVFRGGTPWAKKAFKLMENRELEARVVSKLLHSILRDSTLCLELQACDAPMLTEQAASQIPTKDRYLIEMYLKAEAHLLITTDQALVEALAASSLGVRTQLRDDFLKTY